jgi:hypothetical protein
VALNATPILYGTYFVGFRIVMVHDHINSQFGITE